MRAVKSFLPWRHLDELTEESKNRRTVTLKNGNSAAKMKIMIS